MNEKALNFHSLIKNIILNSKNEQDSIALNDVLEQREKWLNEYSSSDKNALLIWILEKDNELRELQSQKMNELKAEILNQVDRNTNRSKFKMFD